MKHVILSNGELAIVDEEDYEKVSALKWNYQKGWRTSYAARNDKTSGKRKYMYMHRFILGVDDGSILVDHINGDGLDNRKCNLRTCNNSENQANRKQSKISTQPYKGVRRRRTMQDKYEARINKNGKEIYLGRFDTAIEAAMAYDNASIELNGEFANTNFSRSEIDDYFNDKRNSG